MKPVFSNKQQSEADGGGQIPTTSRSKIKWERQQPDYTRITHMEKKSSHASL